MPPRRGIVDAPVSGQLIGFLSVLAAALAVALARERAVAAERPADAAEGERQIDVPQRVVDALGLLFGTASGENHGALDGTKRARRVDQGRFGYAGHALDQLGPIRRGDPKRFIESFRPPADLLLVDQILANEQVQKSVG